MNCAPLITSGSEKASAGERPPPPPPLCLGPNHTRILTLGRRCSAHPGGIHCWGGWSRRESRNRSCAGGSEEDAHEQGTIQAAGLTPLLPSPGTLCPPAWASSVLRPQIFPGLAHLLSSHCSCLGKPCSAILFFSLPDASSLQPLSSPHALLCRIVPEIRNKRRGKKIGWIWGGGGGVSLPLSFSSSPCLPISGPTWHLT